MGRDHWTAGPELTATEVCNIFKEVGIEEPDWQTVGSELGLELYGHVSVAELYNAWCNCDPSWEKLSQALGKFPKYHEVAGQAKKKAGASDFFSFLVNRPLCLPVCVLITKALIVVTVSYVIHICTHKHASCHILPLLLTSLVEGTCI